MSEQTKIEWTHWPRTDGTLMPGHTANLWWGCTEVHAGCDNCYARVLSHRWGHELWGNDVPRRMVKSVWSDLAKYQKAAAAAGEIHSVFVGSMMDIFEKPMPVVDSDMKPITTFPHIPGSRFEIEIDKPVTTQDLRNYLFLNISDGFFNNLRFLFLTKRPSNINKYLPETWKTNPPKNVMFGTSPVDQKTADTLIPQLLAVKGYKFLSVEPQLDELSIAKFGDLKDKGDHIFTRFPIHWVINGGESGHGKRPYNPDWGRKLRDECKMFSVSFFMKQIDKVQEIPDDLMVRQYPAI